jgi:tryptophan synthase alpha chain
MATDRIAERFARLREEGRTGLILYVTAGFPDIDATLELVPALADAGADLIELGVPFSDPLADGPTIQESSFHALRNGVTLEGCLGLVERLRKRDQTTPIALFGYYNPVLRYGVEAFARRARESGVDGVIVPDLPPDEAGPLLDACRPHGVHLIPLLAPTSTDARMRLACQGASGFIYCVSLTGVTGARDRLPEGLFDFLARVRRHTELPLAVGFGVSKRDHVESIGSVAQAATVGSALIRVLQESPRDLVVERARRFALEMSGAPVP